MRASHRYRLDDLFAACSWSVLLGQVHRVYDWLIRAILMRNADIRLRWMQLARWAVHFLVHANAVLPDVALISNLGCDTPLVERTSR